MPRKPIRLPLPFEEAVADMLKVKPAPKIERKPAKLRARGKGRKAAKARR